MPSITEQFSAVTKSQLEAQFNIFNTFAHTAVDSVEKLIALHLSATKSSVEKSSAAAKQLLEAKDAKAFLSAQQQAPASFDSVLAYGRELYAIASGAQAELIKSTRGAAQALQVPALPVLAAPVAVAKAPAPVAAPVSAPVVEPVAPVAPVAAPAVATVAAAPVVAAAPAPVAPPASIPAAVSATVQAAVKAVEAPAPQAAAAVAAQHKPVAATVAPTAPEKIQAAAVKPGAVELDNKPPKLKAVPPKAKTKK